MTSVTEEMIEAACRAYWPLHWADHIADADKTGIRGNMSRAIEAALSASPAAQTEDWVLVPREPTQAMREVDAGTSTTDPLAWNAALYRAMIAAAPSAPQPTEPVAGNIGWQIADECWLSTTEKANLARRINAALSALASPVAQQRPVYLQRVNIPEPGKQTRIVGFRIQEGDEAWGTHGLSEPLTWLEKLVPYPSASPVAQQRDEVIEFLGRAVEVWEAEVFDEAAADAVLKKARDLLSVLSPERKDKSNG